MKSFLFIICIIFISGCSSNNALNFDCYSHSFKSSYKDQRGFVSHYEYKGDGEIMVSKVGNDLMPDSNSAELKLTLLNGDFYIHNVLMIPKDLYGINQWEAGQSRCVKASKASDDSVEAVGIECQDRKTGWAIEALYSKNRGITYFGEKDYPNCDLRHEQFLESEKGLAANCIH